MHLRPLRQDKMPTLVVVALLGLVYAVLAITPVSAAGKPKAANDPRGATKNQAQPADGVLPRPVQEMADAMMAAVQSGRIEDMKDALDWNELKPELGPQPVPDAIAHWKALSKDGTGRDILDVLGALLGSKPLAVPYGRDLENNRLYLWPRFADGPVAALTGDDAALLGRLAAPNAIAAMQAKGRYTGWRLVIGSDGTWHSFRTVD
jgi:hypothetical protein